MFSVFFLQALEDGFVTDSKGKKVPFSNLIIIMTSNAGAKKLSSKNPIGFENIESEQKRREQIKKEMLEELKKFLSPEFFSRIDETIIFNTLGIEELTEIAVSELSELQSRVKKLGYSFIFDRTTAKKLAEKCDCSESGAREIRKTVEQNIQNLISDKILDGANKNIPMILEMSDCGEYRIREHIPNGC